MTGLLRSPSLWARISAQPPPVTAATIAAAKAGASYNSIHVAPNIATKRCLALVVADYFARAQDRPDPVFVTTRYRTHPTFAT